MKLWKREDVSVVNTARALTFSLHDACVSVIRLLDFSDNNRLKLTAGVLQVQIGLH